MSSFPRSPRLCKGALGIIDEPGASPKFIYFQYNLDSIKRTLSPKFGKTKEGNSEPFRLEGAPSESMDISIELDATDYLEYPDQNPVAVGLGINPQLAALETMIYPKSTQIIANAALAAMGTKEIIPPLGPLVLFVFGATKVLPVKITKFMTTEEAYDTNLNPIRAKVDLTLEVLTYEDLQQSQMAYSLYHANHIFKEILAQLAPAKGEN
ncbi:MAG: hypothetical protein LBQ98_10410 [Nitrososphaerota archaeon]|jgi:hypothetical protein|nr:hypothetical protein [Nitrososphaerota archaeon]